MSFLQPSITPKPILELSGVGKSFGSSRALEPTDLSVRDGEFLTFLGPSGCGKTTLIRMIAGFETPSEGDIRIDGQSILDAPPYRRPIGMVFQNLALFPHLTVAQNIAYGLKNMKTAPDAIRQKVAKALEMVAMEGFGERYTGEISGGQRQRVALARAIVTEPRVLLLDEPLGALDMKIRRQMQLELKQIQQTLGTTFIFVTHDQEEALTMSDRIAVFRKGQVEQVDTPQEIYEKPRTRFVAEFVGDTNFFCGTVAAGPAGAMVLPLADLGVELSLAEGRTPAGQSLGASLRPQNIRISNALDARVAARVDRYAYAGQNVRAWLACGNTTLVADWRANEVRELPAVGSQLGLTWDDADVVTVAL